MSTPQRPSPPSTDRPPGLECAKCGCRHWEVVYTVQRTRFIQRRRECRHCGHRVTTRERIIGARFTA
ncbi:MAG TPA: hypothetical protein PKC43_06325 [Phycisphaerales bacterium]|nr:hypothetical protein [Phycisphaerales bacterium]HMP37048.1 hypothetical protein [Phycisphaerales bacterium]